MRRNERPAEALYSPYRLDWRFLPKPLLILKDMVRPLIVRASLSAARTPVMSAAWHGLIGRRTRKAIEAAGLLFIHIPKTGGTSISQRLYGRNLPHYTAKFYMDVFPDLFGRMKTFAVIRDPIARVMSSYRFICAGGTDMMASNHYARLLIERAGSFDGFVDLLHAHPDRIRLFEVLEKQSSYVCDDGRILVNHLFALDAAGGLSNGLTDLLGTQPLPRLNATKPTNLRMSEETRAKLGQLYREDIALFARLRQLPEPPLSAEAGHLLAGSRMML